jgi:hypothetical protein
MGAYDWSVNRSGRARDAGQESDAAQLLIYLEAARIALRRTFEDHPSGLQPSFAER